MTKRIDNSTKSVFAQLGEFPGVDDMRCRYCHGSAGWFSTEHEKCKTEHWIGSGEMRDMAMIFALRGTPHDYENRFNSLAVATHNTARCSELTIAGVHKAFDSYFASRTENQATEDHLYAACLKLLTHDQRCQVPLRRLEMMGRPRDLSKGRETINPDYDAQLPDRKKGEILIWTFQDVRYLEEKMHRRYEGRSSGVSVRVMKGVSVRVGQSQGRFIEHASMDDVDIGSLTITSQRISFAGNRKAFKLFYAKLALIQPYSDGLKVIRDSPSAKPQMFMFEDGWFVNEVFHRLG